MSETTDRDSAALTGYPFSRSPEEVRVQWMRLFGVPEDEILRSLKDDPPVSIGDEESQLDAIISIRESYGSGELFPEVHENASTTAPVDRLVRPLLATRLERLQSVEPETCSIDEVRRMAGEILWLRAQPEPRGPIDVTKPGTAIFIYTDKGPKGPCGQSVSMTCNHTSVHIFRDEDTMREWVSEHRKALSSGKQAEVRFVVVGEGQTLGTSFEVHD